MCELSLPSEGNSDASANQILSYLLQDLRTGSSPIDRRSTGHYYRFPIGAERNSTSEQWYDGWTGTRDSSTPRPGDRLEQLPKRMEMPTPDFTGLKLAFAPHLTTTGPNLNRNAWDKLCTEVDREEQTPTPSRKIARVAMMSTCNRRRKAIESPQPIRFDTAHALQLWESDLGKSSPFPQPVPQPNTPYTHTFPSSYPVTAAPAIGDHLKAGPTPFASYLTHGPQIAGTYSWMSIVMDEDPVLYVNILLALRPAQFLNAHQRRLKHIIETGALPPQAPLFYF